MTHLTPIYPTAYHTNHGVCIAIGSFFILPVDHPTDTNCITSRENERRLTASRPYFGIDPARSFNGKPQATVQGGRSRLRLAVKRRMNGIAVKRPDSNGSKVSRGKVNASDRQHHHNESGAAGDGPEYFVPVQFFILASGSALERNC